MPNIDPSDNHRPAVTKPFDVLEGDDTDMWQRTPEQLQLPAPVAPSTYSDSNLLRFGLREHDKIVHEKKETRTLPKTSRTDIIREVYRKALPEGSDHLIQMLMAEALEYEVDYEEDGLDKDPLAIEELDDLTVEYSHTFLVQGLTAFIKASEDYDEGLHKPLLEDARRFGVYIIKISDS